MIQARGKLPDVHVVQWLGMFWLDFGRCSRSTWWNVSCFSFKFWVKEEKKLRREFNGFLIIYHVSCDTAFLSEDATNVSPNGEDAKNCWSAKVLQVNSSAISKALFPKWSRRRARASGKYLPAHDFAGICHYGQRDWLRYLSGQVVPSQR